MNSFFAFSGFSIFQLLQPELVLGFLSDLCQNRHALYLRSELQNVVFRIPQNVFVFEKSSFFIHKKTSFRGCRGCHFQKIVKKKDKQKIQILKTTFFSVSRSDDKLRKNDKIGLKTAKK